MKTQPERSKKLLQEIYRQNDAGVIAKRYDAMVEMFPDYPDLDERFGAFISGNPARRRQTQRSAQSRAISRYQFAGRSGARTQKMNVNSVTKRMAVQHRHRFKSRLRPTTKFTMDTMDAGQQTSGLRALRVLRVASGLCFFDCCFVLALLLLPASGARSNREFGAPTARRVSARWYSPWVSKRACSSETVLTWNLFTLPEASDQFILLSGDVQFGFTGGPQIGPGATVRRGSDHHCRA